MTSCARRPSNFGANAKCIASITDTLIPAGLNGKVGYIDKNGKWIIVPQFDDVSLFGRNDLAAVEIIFFINNCFPVFYSNWETLINNSLSIQEKCD
jgi:hypothetical protein